MISKKKVSVIFILLIFFTSFLLRIYKINDLMYFIGDQGWFYLSARSFILEKSIPLVGIASSHVWVHQGPFWTYILSVIFTLFGFNPLAPGYFSAFLDAICVVLVYYISLKLYSQKVAIFSSILYAFSPYIILSSRMPYHTSLIPLFTLLFFYFLVKVSLKKIESVPLVILFLSILYNFELATQVLWLVFASVVFINFKYIKSHMNKKLFVSSIACFVFPLIPVIIYDFSHGFNQTLKFAAWVFISPLRSLIFGGSSSNFMIDFLTFFSLFLKKTIFPLSLPISLFLFLSSMFSLLYIYKKRKNIKDLTLFITIFIPLIAFTINKTPSDAYLPIFFPIVIISLALFLDSIKKKHLGIFIALIISSVNIYSLLSSNYFSGTNQNFYKDRLRISKKIIKSANNSTFLLKGKGEGSEFSSFTNNYDYLTWYLGGNLSKKADLEFVIEEKDGKIYLYRQKR